LRTGEMYFNIMAMEKDINLGISLISGECWCSL
jgi:hypothetical protein